MEGKGHDGFKYLSIYIACVIIHHMYKAIFSSIYLIPLRWRWRMPKA